MRSIDSERERKGLRTPWNKLRPVQGYVRVPDDEHGRRMLRCEIDGQIVTSLGVGYHIRGKRHQEALAIATRTRLGG